MGSYSGSTCIFFHLGSSFPSPGQVQQGGNVIYGPLYAVLLSALLLYSAEAAAGIEKIGIGSRAIGMGTAFVSIADDASAVYWNPAGIAMSVSDSAQINRQLSLMYSPLYGLSYLKHKFIAYTQDRLLPNRYFGSLGFGIVELDLSPNADDFQSLSYTEDTFLVCWAYSFSLRPIFQRFSLGATFKYFNIRTAKNAFGYGGDFGFLGRHSFKLGSWALDFRLGGSVQDFGKSSLWYSGSYSPARQEFVEPSYRCGIALGLRRESSNFSHLLVSAELHRRDKYALDNTAAILGAEVSLLSGFDLRLGVQDIEAPRYAFGVGLVIPNSIVSGSFLAIDIALMTHPDLNNTLAFSLSLFGGGNR